MADKNIGDNLGIEESKRKWVKQFEKVGESHLAEKLGEMDIEDVAEEETFQQLINIASDKKAVSYLETMRKDIEDLLGLNRSSFDVEKWKDLPKTEIADKMADHVVNSKQIRPVYMGDEEESIDFYRMNRETGLWEYISKANLYRIGNKMAGSIFTGHTKREFKHNMMFHRNRLKMQEMGTDRNWLPVNGRKKLYLGDLSDLSDLRVEDIEEEDYALHSFNAEYDPEAEAPRFKEFVDTLLDGKEEQIKTLQEFMGWLLRFPDRKFKKALLILGVSNSGKSQLGEMVEYMFQSEYGKSVSNLSMPMLGAKRTFHVNQLESSIVNLDKDLSGRNIENPSTVKKVTAQERLMVEPKGGDSFTVYPTAKHFVAANVSPQIENTSDDAFYGRFLTLKAPNSVPREERTRDLGKKIFEEEASGILNWMLEGLERLERKGEFTLMPTAMRTKRMWWQFGNSIHRFLWQVCDITKDVEEDVVPKDDLYDWYEEWLEGNPDVSSKVTRRKFKSLINEMDAIQEGRTRVRGTRERVFRGVKVNIDDIRDVEEDFKDERSEEERSMD